MCRYVTDLAHFDRAARAAMLRNVDEDDSAVTMYLDHHADDPDLIRPGMDTDAFVAALRLQRVGLYANLDASEPEAVFDYSIGPDRTQYLVAVTFGAEGRVDDICVES